MRKFPVHHHVLKIQNEPVIQDWIQGLSPVAQENYLQMIAEFSLVTGLSPTEMLETTYKEYNENTPSWNLSIKEWFKQFETHSQEYQRSKITYNHRVAIIKSFFHFHELETPKESHKRRRGQKLKFGEGNKRTGLTRADLQRAINACWNSRLKAIILTQCSSGMAVADPPMFPTFVSNTIFIYTSLIVFHINKYNISIYKPIYSSIKFFIKKSIKTFI